MMQKLPTTMAIATPVSKSNAGENQSTTNTDVAQTAQSFHALLKKQTQSNQSASYKSAETERVATQSDSNLAPSIATQKSVAATKHKNEALQSITLESQQDDQEDKAIKAVDEMVALLSLPTDAKSVEIENSTTVEPLVESAQVVEQTVATFTNAIAVNTGISKSESAPLTVQASNLNVQPQVVDGVGQQADQGRATVADVADFLVSDSATSAPEQTTFATQLNAAKMPMLAKQENIAESMTPQLELERPLNVPSVLIEAQNNLQPVPTTHTPVASQHVVASNTIEAKFGNASWNQAVSQRVVWMAGAGEQSATLTLNPPDLGPLQVVVQVHNGSADTTFTSDNPDVRQALQDGMEHLREKMRESGVQLGQTNVQSGEQSRQDFQQMAEKNRLAPSQRAENNPSPLQNNAAVNKVTRVTNGLVDTFA